MFSKRTTKIEELAERMSAVVRHLMLEEDMRRELEARGVTEEMQRQISIAYCAVMRARDAEQAERKRKAG